MVVVHALNMLSSGLEQSTARITAEIASKMVTQRCITFQTQFAVVMKGGEEGLGIFGSNDQIIKSSSLQMATPVV